MNEPEVATRDARTRRLVGDAIGPRAAGESLNDVEVRVRAVVALVDDAAVLRSQRDAALAEVDYLRRLAERVIGVHESVVMDTPEDRDLHDRACAAFRAALSYPA